MGIKKIIVNILLNCLKICLPFIKINPNQVAFISLEGKELKDDLKLIYDQFDPKYKKKCVLIDYNKKTWKTNFLYLINIIKQFFVINQSHLVYISDNNYVISHYKRKSVKVIQVWHASGAIKKFGNVIKREYPVRNYDYILANSEYWINPYSKAFGVNIENIKVLGMPRIDLLFQDNIIKQAKSQLFNKYPELKNKRILLYAPTFRGNIYKGFTYPEIDLKKISENLDENTILICKYHPLLNRKNEKLYPNIYNLSQEETYHLFYISDALISDYSSIIFDYMLLNKPIYLYAYDYESYFNEIGLFVDYKQMNQGYIRNEEELLEAIKHPEIHYEKEKYFTYQDGKNIDRVLQFSYHLLKEEVE